MYLAKLIAYTKAKCNCIHCISMFGVFRKVKCIAPMLEILTVYQYFIFTRKCVYQRCMQLAN